MFNLAYEYQEMGQAEKAVSVLEQARNLTSHPKQLEKEIEKDREQLPF